MSTNIHMRYDAIMQRWRNGILFIVLVIGVVIFASLYKSSQLNQQEYLDNNCAVLTSRQLNAERSLAVILSEKSVLALRLEGEKNFSPPGGHIQADESPEEALSRELQEELGITVTTAKLRPYKTYCEIIGANFRQRTRLFFIDSWNGSFSTPSTTELKWVFSSFGTDSDADTELQKLIQYLQQDKLIN